MRVAPIKFFLTYIETCHRALADLYLRLSLEAEDEKVKLLLNFMRNKEQLAYLRLREYKQQAPVGILETWLDNLFEQDFPLQCKAVQSQIQLNINDVITLAINFDTQLIEQLQTAAYNSSTIEAEIALENLSNQEEETLHQIIMASNEFEYM